MEVLKVAHIIGKWVGGGVENAIMNYYRALDHKKIQFVFLCDSDSTRIPKEEIEALGGEVIIIPPYQKIFSYLKTLKRIFKENNYEIVHSHINTLSVFSLFAAKRAGVPVRIAHSHSTTNKSDVLVNIIKQILRPFSKLFATHYMACSKHAGTWLFGKKAPVYILNNGIELDKFIYNPITREDIRKELNIKENAKVIGHLGRFVTAKNHLFLINIFKEIVKKDPNFYLVLGGEGPLKKDVETKIKELNLDTKVIVLGQIKDVYKYYQAFDLFVLPSLYEGLGMVLIEAEVSGLKCIASTNVSKEADITGNVEFLSLKVGAEAWANKILETNLNYNRNLDNTIYNSGYDIKKEVKKLKEFYLKLRGE